MSLSSQPSFDPAMSGLLLRSLVPASYVGAFPLATVPNLTNVESETWFPKEAVPVMVECKDRV